MKSLRALLFNLEGDEVEEPARITLEVVTRAELAAVELAHAEPGSTVTAFVDAWEWAWQSEG